MDKLMFILFNIIILSLMPKTLIILGIIYFTDWTDLHKPALSKTKQ